MALFDEIKHLAETADKAAAEHPAQVDSALAKVGGLVDRQTGGTHHAQIVDAEQKADELIAKKASPARGGASQT